MIGCSLRTKEWRYTRYFDGSEELFNQAADPKRNINAYQRDVEKYRELGLQPPLD